MICKLKSNRCSMCGRQYDDPGEYQCAAIGVGDMIAALTSAVGIKPCGGCKKRQEWLNRTMPPLRRARKAVSSKVPG